MPKSTETLITVNPDGTISADFTGHISALGVDLVAGTVNSPTIDHRVSWHKDTPAGIIVGDLYSYLSGITAADVSFTTLEGRAAAAESSELLLNAGGAGAPGPALGTYIDLYRAAAGSGLLSHIGISTTGVTGEELLQDQNGRSSFARTRVRGGQTAPDTLTTVGIGTYTPMVHGPSVTVGAGKYLFSASGEIHNTSAGSNDMRVALIKGGDATVLFAFLGWLLATTGTAAMVGATVNGLITCNAGDIFSLAVATSNLQATFGELNGWVLQAERISA